MSGLAVYALVAGEPSAPLEAGLRLLPCAGMSAVVGDAEPAAATPESLAAHDARVRRLADRFDALLPVRFGERVRSEEELSGLLGPRAQSLAEALERVRGCAQMTLRVFGEPGPEPEPAFSGTSGAGTRYLEARRRDLERARSLPEIEPLLEILRPILRGERIERRGQGLLLGSAYHLVRREDVETYLRAVQIVHDTGERLGGRKVAVTGPWPPYAFAPGLGDSG